jgi:hypothetical protein
MDGGKESGKGGDGPGGGAGKARAVVVYRAAG